MHDTSTSMHTTPLYAHNTSVCMHAHLLVHRSPSYFRLMAINPCLKLSYGMREKCTGSNTKIMCTSDIHTYITTQNVCTVNYL